jgi:ABC-type spermidine/putrescine transport system permease subunit II
VTPEINALATIMVSVVAAGIVIAGLIMSRADKRRQLEQPTIEVGSR